MKTIQIRGVTIGYVDNQTNKVAYLNARGQVVAYYIKNDDRTITVEGRFVGKGDMGLFVLAD